MTFNAGVPVTSQLERVKRLRDERRFDEAIVILHTILDADPSNSKAFQELGYVHRFVGDRNAAQFAFQRALVADPTNVQAGIEAAIELRELGRLTDSELGLRGILESAPSNFAALLEMGRVKRRQGNHHEALAAFEAAVRVNPAHVGVKADLAGELRELGRLDEAHATLHAALENHPQQFDLLLGLAQVSRRKGDRAASLAAFEAAATGNPTHLGVQIEIAADLRELGHLDQAMKRLSGVLEKQPQHFGALVEIARLHRRNGDHAAALTAFKAASTASPDHAGVKADIAAVLRELGSFEEAESSLQSTLHAHPGHFGALLELGRIKRRQGAHAAALEAFQAAAAGEPSNVPIKADIAGELRELGRLGEAEALLRLALAAHPRHLDLLVASAQIARRKGDRYASLAAFESAMEAYPAHIGVKIESASDLRELGRLADAEALLRNALAHEPANFAALVGLGHVLRQRLHKVGSLAAFEAASAVNPTHVGVLMEVVTGLRELDRTEEAERKLGALLERDPHQVAALGSLGSLRLQRFELSNAEQVYRSVVELAPDQPVGHLGLGQIARRRGDRVAALAHFRQAVATNPEHLGAALEVVAELRELGRYAEAHQHLTSLPGGLQDPFPRLMQTGHLYRKEGARQKALDAFAAAHASRPWQVAPIAEMAVEQRALGRPNESIELLMRGLSIDPTNLGMLMQLAEHYFAAEEFEDAWDASIRAQTACPNRYPPYLIASRVALELGRKGDARRLLDDAVNRAGPHPEITAAKISLLVRDRDWNGAKALLNSSGGETKAFGCLWAHQAQIAIKIGEYELAEAVLYELSPAATSDASRALILKGQLAEARWQLHEAASHYRQGIALNPNDSGAHFDLARTSLKLLDLETCRKHMRRMIETNASSTILRGQSLNLSQNHIGQLIDEFAMDRQLLDQLMRIRQLPLGNQALPLKELVSTNPDHTPSAIMLLIAMRQAGDLVQSNRRSPQRVTEAIPRRIVQYWDAPDPPMEIAELMSSWRDTHPGFEYVRLDDKTAISFLTQNGLTDTRNAFRRAREPAQKADLIRLAYLAVLGGFYIDADDRCLSDLFSFVQTNTDFVAFQEDYGTLGNNFLGAIPGHPVIVRALHLATEALTRGDADFLWLATGPGLLTRAFCQTLASEETAAANFPAVIVDMGYLHRHIGFHCPVAYKKSERHWSRTSFARIASNAP